MRITKSVYIYICVCAYVDIYILLRTLYKIDRQRKRGRERNRQILIMHEQLDRWPKTLIKPVLVHLTAGIQPNHRSVYFSLPATTDTQNNNPCFYYNNFVVLLTLLTCWSSDGEKRVRRVLGSIAHFVAWPIIPRYTHIHTRTHANQPLRSFQQMMKTKLLRSGS